VALLFAAFLTASHPLVAPTTTKKTNQASSSSEQGVVGFSPRHHLPQQT
jgi:hypothetical protein